MAILVLAEHDGKALSPATAKALTAAMQMGGEIDILVAGAGVEAIAGEAQKLAGVRKVRLAEAAPLEHQLAEPLAALLVAMASEYDALVASAGSTGKNVMPRVAALLDVMQISDIVAVQSADTFVRPIYAGNALATVRSRDAKKIVTVRTAAFGAAATDGSAPIEPVSVPDLPSPARFVGIEATQSDRPDLGSARIVVSGGRALGSKEQFDALIGPLAEKLGAAIGASRAAVDAGYVPNDCQVGQTGKIVAPELYLACGISGAIQHLAGMKDAKIIVAINKDPEAPIFQIADYGLVADIFTALPQLTEKL